MNLVYAATSRCPCGAGLAYHKGAGAFGEDAYWDCAEILLGVADPAVQHTAMLPFIFYEIKSEKQPSAHGASTRLRDDDE